MKKLLTILLTLVMAVCLINLNNSHTRAEEDGTPGEQQQAIQAQLAQQPTQAQPAQQQQAGVVESNQATLIHNADELVNFLELDQDNKVAELANNITYDKTNGIYVYDVNVRGGHATINLKGHNIDFKSCLSLKTSQAECHINIFNGDTSNTSTLKAMDSIGSMIATRLYKHSSEKKLEVNIGKDSNNNAGNGKIVFDGNNFDAVVGIAAGYHSYGTHDPGYYDNSNHTVNLTGSNESLVFKNFKSSNATYGSAAVTNSGATLDIDGVIIKDSYIGVGAGQIDPTAYTKVPTTTIKDTIINGCTYGVVNGVYIDEERVRYLLTDVTPGKIEIKGNSKIQNNYMGLSYYNVSDPIDTTRSFTLTGNALVDDNDVIDFYCEGKSAIYTLDNLSVNKFHKFSVNMDYWKGTLGTIDITVAQYGSNTINNNSLFAVNDGRYAHVDTSGTPKKIVLSTIPNTIHPTTTDKGDMASKDGAFVYSFNKNNSNQATAHIEGITYDNINTAVQVVNLTTGEKLEKGTDKDYYVTTGSVKVVLTKKYLDTLPVGNNDIYILINASANNTTSPSYNFYVGIKVINPSSPDPSPKDESCEKVIGPTWHWNNDKGICEDYGVVGTSTR